MAADALIKFRQKFPQYQDIPDQELASRIVARHPEYQDVLGDVAGAQPSAEPVSSPAPQTTMQSLAGKAAGITNSLARPFLNPPSPNLPQAQFNQGANIIKTGIAADKNVPAENLLPAAGAIAGSMIGGAATLPSGAGVPFGATIGAGIGGQVGDTARQYVAALRGHSGVAKTPEEAVGGTVKTGGEMAAGELAGATILKGLEAIGATSIARKGIGKLTEFLTGETKPVDYAIAKDTIAPYVSKPAADTSDASNFVKDVLDQKGIKITDTTPQRAIPQGTLQQWRAAGMTDEQIANAARSTRGLEGFLEDSTNAQKPKLSSDLNTPPINDYKGLANVYQDLNKPDLTYGQVKQMQSAIGDMANFNSSEKSGVEKIYGQLYYKLGELLDKTAEANGFTAAHDFAQESGRKFYQNSFLNSLLSDSRKFAPSGPRPDFGLMASKLNGYSDLELKNIFGDNTKYIQTLRDLTNHGAAIEKSSIYTRLSGAGRPMATVKVGNILDKINAPSNYTQILNRNLAEQASQFNPFSTQNAVNSVVAPAIPAGLTTQSKQPQRGLLRR